MSTFNLTINRLYRAIDSNPGAAFITKSALCFGGCLVVHQLISKYTKMKRQTKWYAIHTVGNLAITILSAKDMIRTMVDPINSVENIANHNSLTCLQSYPILIMSSIHLYHILLYFKEMTTIDWIHHLANSGVVGSICTFIIRGSIVNHGLFFMCGLPGGIDYLMLTLNDYNLLSRLNEKRINRYLNMYIRLPGILFNCYAGFVYFLYNKMLPCNVTFGAIVLILNSWNSIYFAQRVVENYGYHMGRQSLIKEDENVIISNDNKQATRISKIFKIPRGDNPPKGGTPLSVKKVEPSQEFNPTFHEKGILPF